MPFVAICLQELHDALERDLRYNAIAHRASKMEESDFKNFLDSFDKTEKPKNLEVDHEANLREFLKGM